MELVKQYIAALLAASRAGSDVRTLLNGISVPVIAIRIDEEKKDLEITYITKDSPHDKKAHIPLRSVFTAAFNDYPNEIRMLGWE